MKETYGGYQFAKDVYKGIKVPRVGTPNKEITLINIRQMKRPTETGKKVVR
jgi:hypothetical protein